MTPGRAQQTDFSDSRPIRSALGIAALFFSTAVVLSGVLPLWLDEILQLIETRGTTPSQLIHLLTRHPGAAPLGYLVQQSIFSVAGYSVRLARFPSAVFVAGAVFLTGLLGARLGMRRPWIAATLCAAFPLTLRYACESRTYGPALFFSTLATYLFMRLAKEPALLTAAGYCLTLMLAVYTQPYAITVGLAHIVWAACQKDLRTTLFSAVAGALAALSFAPWYVWTKSLWASHIEDAGVHFSFSAKTPLMMFRELVGGGYWGSGLLAILFLAAVWNHRRQSRNATLLLLLIFVPTVVAIAADAKFGYFVATRQIMWVLPAVALLAGLGMERLTVGGNNRPTVGIGLLFAGICLWQDYRFFATPKEDWAVAAAALSAEVSHGACLVVVPEEEVRSYAFFRPELATSNCPAPQTVLAVTPYATEIQRRNAISALTAGGYSRTSAKDAGKTEIQDYSR